MCDAQCHMQALYQLLQGCSCLSSMPDLHMHQECAQCLHIVA